jgi:hypothetical protein
MPVLLDAGCRQAHTQVMDLYAVLMILFLVAICWPLVFLVRALVLREVGGFQAAMAEQWSFLRTRRRRRQMLREAEQHRSA